MSQHWLVSRAWVTAQLLLWSLLLLRFCKAASDFRGGWIGKAAACTQLFEKPVYLRCVQCLCCIDSYLHESSCLLYLRRGARSLYIAPFFKFIITELSICPHPLPRAIRDRPAGGRPR